KSTAPDADEKGRAEDFGTYWQTRESNVQHGGAPCSVASEVYVDLELDLMARVVAIDDCRARLAVGEHVAIGMVEPVLELHVDPVARHATPGAEGCGRV